MDPTEQVGEIPAGRVGFLPLWPYLVGVAPVAKWALGGDECLIAELPFRVGRETRESLDSRRFGKWLRERRKGKGRPNNDLYIHEPELEKHISREHFFIDQNPDGIFSLVDRGSILGTLVEGLLIGGEEKGGTVQLFHGAVIIPGGQDSPYVFRFEIREPGGRLGKPTPRLLDFAERKP